MLEHLPYLTFWQVAEKWAEELKQPIMEVIQVMRAHATSQDLLNSFSKQQDPFESRSQPSHDCSTPPLPVYPTAFFNSRGELSRARVFNATRMVEIDTRNGIGVEKKFRTSYRTREYNAAEAFLNSANCPPEPTEEVKKHLTHFSIKKEDFEKYCNEKGYPLPQFWFPVILHIGGNDSGKLINDRSKGGRPKSPLSEAVSYVYLKFRDQGNTEILRPNKVSEFLARFKEMIDDKNTNFCDYVAERIRSIKITRSSCTVATQELTPKPGLKRESRDYTKKDISKLLTELRKKHPLA